MLVSFVSVVLRMRVPITVGLSYYDDLLFLRSAGSLINHDWLGPFDNRTLAKGPSYPAFIAVAHWFGIPVKVGEQLTYLLACGCVAACIWIVSHRLVLATVAFSVLALDPINYNSPSAELVRDNWYASLGLLFPAAVFLALSMAMRGSGSSGFYWSPCLRGYPVPLTGCAAKRVLRSCPPSPSWPLACHCCDYESGVGCRELIASAAAPEAPCSGSSVRSWS